MGNITFYIANTLMSVCVQDGSSSSVLLKLLPLLRQRSPLKAEMDQFSASSTESSLIILYFVM